LRKHKTFFCHPEPEATLDVTKGEGSLPAGRQVGWDSSSRTAGLRMTRDIEIWK